jgi:hypothetical protein
MNWFRSEAFAGHNQLYPTYAGNKSEWITLYKCPWEYSTMHLLHAVEHSPKKFAQNLYLHTRGGKNNGNTKKLKNIICVGCDRNCHIVNCIKSDSL